MPANAIRDELEQAFERLRVVDASLDEQLAALSDASRQRLPGLADAIDRLVARLHESGVGASAPQCGEPMPPFHLPDEAGHIVSLEQLLERAPVAITFHRGHWCPYCRISLQALARAQAESGDGQIVAIMPERQRFAADLKSAGRIPFPILTDIDNGYALSLNLAFWLGTELRAMLAGQQDLAAFQGNDAWMLPVPATFVVGGDGIIKARFVDPDYRKRMAIDDLLAALRS